MKPKKSDLQRAAERALFWQDLNEKITNLQHYLRQRRNRKEAEHLARLGVL